MKRRSKSPRMSAKKALDNLFSKYIRLSNADKMGNCVCVTCGKVLPWKQIQNGHYVSRNNMATRWVVENCAPQCVGCNVFGRGKPDEFAIYIMRKYGPEQLEKLNQAKHRVTKFHTYDITAMCVVYKDALEKLNYKGE